jgi:phage terminase large subunit
VLGFGGSRGAAKSGAVRRLALILATEQPGIIVWIMRRVWDDLNKDHVMPLFVEYPELAGFYRAGNKELRLPNGSSIFFIHAGDTGRAKRKARGPQAHYIFLEQAEEFTQEEMEQLAGSNRAPGAAPGWCKRIYTFNPGGVGTAYLRRIFHLKEYRDNEDRRDFLFIQGFGWDNFEWFRGLGIVSEWDFYHSPEWSNDRRFDVFTQQTDFGRKLNALPQSQRIGELMGSFESFAGQYYSDVWEQSTCVLAADLVARIIQPWWRRWLATDWGFSHYAATGWFASGLLAAEQAADLLGVSIGSPVRVIILYRELVCNDVPEPELARLVIARTPDAERREVRDHLIGHDAWAKRGSANTVVEQMDPILAASGMPRLSRADIDRVGGWRLMYNAWASARRLRKWDGPEAFAEKQEDVPALFISAACPEVISAIPMLICKEEDPTDVEKMAGQVHDDVADMVRYGLKSYLTARGDVPYEITAAQTYQAYQDPTSRVMAMRRLEMEHSKSMRLQRRRRF